MNHQDRIAIDIHTHAEVSCWNRFDAYGEEHDRAADTYFRSSNRPTIAETITRYREKKIGCIMFTVDAKSNLGRKRKRKANDEIAFAANENSDMMMAFASIDPHKGKMGAREAERLVKEHSVKGCKFHPKLPMHLDDVAVNFGDMQIVMAHLCFPWQNEALSVATHKPNVWIDLSGWSPNNSENSSCITPTRS